MEHIEIYRNFFRVNLGDAVACLTHEGVRGRGYISSIIGETKRVALIDFGYATVAEKLCEIPESLRRIPEAAVSCQLKQPCHDIRVTFFLCLCIRFLIKIY